MTPEVVGGGESRSAREAAREDAIGFCVVMGWPYNPRTIKALTALLESHAALERERAARIAEAFMLGEERDPTQRPADWYGALDALGDAIAARIRAGGGTVRPGQEGA